ncbi:MAG TPA: dUTPase [Nitrospira sp.]|nr:dUTPase [Nitrospira sp.]
MPTDSDDSIGGLEGALRRQRLLQQAFDPRAVSSNPQQSCEYIKDMVYAAEDELHELTAETGWKPWTTSWHINVDAARGEWIDAFHFMLNLANKLGMTEDMILEMYYAKADKNLARIQAGYDGRSTKCDICHRALDDDATSCHKTRQPDNSILGWCGEFQREYEVESERV